MLSRLLSSSWKKTILGEPDGKDKEGGTSLDVNKHIKQQEMLHHLRSLVHQPNEQARYALEVLERERGRQVLSEALNVLTHRSIPQARPILLRL
jgi:hypothetical protein